MKGRKEWVVLQMPHLGKRKEKSRAREERLKEGKKKKRGRSAKVDAKI